MSVLPEAIRDRVAAFYQELSPDAQRLAALFAAMAQSVTLSAFLKAINQTNVTRNDSKAWTGDDVRELFQAICRAGLGEHTDGKALVPSPLLFAGLAEIVSATQSVGELATQIVDPPSFFRRPSNLYLERVVHGYYWDGNAAMLEHLLLRQETPFMGPCTLDPMQLSFVACGFSAKRFALLPAPYHAKLLPIVRNALCWNLAFLAEWIDFLRSRQDAKGLAALGEALLLHGKLDDAREVAEQLLALKSKPRNVEGWFLQGLLAFVQGDQATAQQAMKQALALRPAAVKVATVTEALVAMYFATQEDLAFQAALSAMTEKKRSAPFALILEDLKRLNALDDDESSRNVHRYDYLTVLELPRMAQLLALHAWAWRGADHTTPLQRMALDIRAHCQDQQSALALVVVSHYLTHYGKMTDPDMLTKELPTCVPWVMQKKRLEPWERQLAQLEQFALDNHYLTNTKAQQPTGDRSKRSRLVWELTTSQDLIIEVLPREQQRNRQGQWSSGRPVALKRLHEQGDKLPFVRPEDLPVIQRIRQSPWHRRGQGFDLDPTSALLRLAGHPLVFRAGAYDQAIEVVKHALKFILTENNATGEAQLAVQPPLEKLRFDDTDTAVWWETPNRIGTLQLSNGERHLTRVLDLDKGTTTIPAAGKERLLTVLGAMKDAFQVFTDVDAAGDAKVDTIDPNLSLQLHLSPWLDGLRVALLAQPLAGLDVFLPPGSGSQVLFGEIDGRPCKTRRHLSEEVARASEIIRACPSLTTNEQGDPYQWTLPDPADCLELLTEAHELRDTLDVRWPQGERFRIASKVSPSQMSLKVSATKDWFEVSGDLTVDDGEVLQLQALLDLLEEGDQFGRFIKLRDGQFIALTREFRQRLQDLEAYTTPGKQGRRRLNPLAAHALTDLTEETDAKLAKKWIAQVQRLSEANAYEAVLPSTLQAELRPYQVDGFQWLARQAHWGVGACLADDMGLGKTVQALALLLHRASEGPALVVAPTSVTRNWLAETLKFAPTLRARLFGPGDRAASLKDLEAFDVVLCTYGLLPIEIDALASISWATIVLDEAQAIKNASTQRWKAAMKLQGDFKILTTGTPIENHLTELHALFQFINPGLLGSAQRFHVKFVDPIAKEREDGARRRLQRLIRPFILRRLKNQVLQDLPPRTDIVLRVEPSKEETAFYEALRRKAVKRLTEKQDEEHNPGERSLRILAEIMKLRRACCHPQLVDPKIPLGSSKLRLFAETLEEILANGHKALVFSQFVDHLAYLREHLDKTAIAYQYLDGQTPAKKRQEAVNAFQRGEGEVFLISLRAGGTGLNLTAADYVIHMDPWWNPAVEDQASDRAHRIGQQRPVTVYRLVVANTIEEKIVELHHKKRDLADSLLSGADSAGKLSPEQLLNLLRDER